MQWRRSADRTEYGSHIYHFTIRDCSAVRVMYHLKLEREKGKMDLMETKAVIRVKHVSKEFGRQKVLDDDVSLEFYGGKIYGIIGRNGSGKTVLLKCICGLLQVSEGTIIVQDKVVGKEVDFPENIGFITAKRFRI